MPTLRNDPKLLARFRRGEREALERVYWAYVDRVERVVRYGFQLLNASGALYVEGLRSDDVADVVQETFTRAFGERARLAYDGLRDYGPFLVTITRNLLVDRLRKQGRELQTGDLEALDGEAAVEERPFADDATMKVVREYLATLPEALRGVHEQRYVRGISQEEAARALGLSRQQIRTLEKRLRDGLAERLERAGLTEDEKSPTNLPAPAYGAKGAGK
jgi:RNA polymerase sigma-70 factor (ECF subfamily)